MLFRDADGTTGRTESETVEKEKKQLALGVAPGVSSGAGGSSFKTFPSEWTF